MTLMPLKITQSTNEANPNSGRSPEFKHYMLKEIFEQAEVVRSCLELYLKNTGFTREPQYSAFQLHLPEKLLADLQQVQILACGTSLHAGLVGQYWLEQVAKIPCRVRSASEFVSAPFPALGNTLTIGVTQSGETADTIAALDFAHQLVNPSLQSWFLAITNKPDGSIANQVDVTIPTPAGKEVGVAATKTFLAQLMAFYCLTLEFANYRQTITPAQLQQSVQELQQLPAQIERLLSPLNECIAVLAKDFVATQSIIFWGTGVNYPIALEGALKFKETTYIHSEGYAAGEFMHGPIAMLDDRIPVVAIFPSDGMGDRMLANARKAKSHGARLIGIATEHQADDLSSVFDDLLLVPKVNPLLSPLLNVIPLQLLAYHTAAHRGVNVDQPRHITKALTI
jgi:glutamine---fructose-6-phosphate transaminase (isomerizing)